MYTCSRNGNLVWDAPCVTGNISKNYDTPPGIYSLTYKEKDRILRGAKKADGTYEYESHVDTGCPLTAGSAFMMPAGDPALAVPSINRAVPTDV